MIIVQLSPFISVAANSYGPLQENKIMINKKYNNSNNSVPLFKCLPTASGL
jgi:hypothetical protein